MKKRYVFVGLLIMCFVAVFSVPTASGIMVEMNKTGICNYNPSAPIVVHPPFKNLDTFKDSELPSFVCEWAKRWRTAADAPPHEVMRKRLDLHNYFSFHGNYDYSGLFDDRISFTVTVPERDNYKFQITLIEYRHRNGKIFRILKDGEQEITPEEFEKTKLFWAHSFCEAARTPFAEDTGCMKQFEIKHQCH